MAAAWCPEVGHAACQSMSLDESNLDGPSRLSPAFAGAFRQPWLVVGARALNIPADNSRTERCEETRKAAIENFQRVLRIFVSVFVKK